MKCTLRSLGVCSTSVRASSAPRVVRAYTSFSKDFKAPEPQCLHWKSPREGARSSLSGSSRVQTSREIIVNINSLRKLRKKSFRESGKVGKICSIRATMNSAATELSETDHETGIEDTLPEQDVQSQHPWDPHNPNYSQLIPESARPYPSFEGWFIRLWDPETNFSAGVILATNYVTEESQVTLLFSPCTEDLGSRNVGAVRSEEDGKYVLRTYAVADMSKNATFAEVLSNNVSEDHKPLNSEPVGFEWKAPDLGMIKSTAEKTEIDVNIMGYTLQARLTNNISNPCFTI